MEHFILVKAVENSGKERYNNVLHMFMLIQFTFLWSISVCEWRFKNEYRNTKK